MPDKTALPISSALSIPMTTQSTYRSSAEALLAQARTELAAGDVRQASEKGWGAATQAVKAVADVRGWQHRNHAALFRAAGQLAAESEDDDIHRWFLTASSLHINFYENWLEADAVAVGLDDIDRLVRRLASVD